MSNYTKDRNIITIDLNGVNGVYRLNINTGEYLGLKGKPVKTISHRGEIYRLFPYFRNEGATNLTYVLYRMFDRCTQTSQFLDYITALQGADRLDALGVEALGLYDDEYAYINEHIKPFTKYMEFLKEENKPFRFSEFEGWFDYEEAKKKYGALLDQTSPEIFKDIKRYVPDYTDEELGVALYYCVRGKMHEYHRGSLEKLREYFQLCRAMKKKPEKVNNFMREYCETKKLYELRKTEFDNERIAQNYQSQADAWKFEFGNHTILIPSCGQDLVTEGELMHHCVGGYVSNIINGTCYICFVRNKKNPKEPYITCQVHRNGEIGQYYLAYDNRISSDEDKAFYQAFQEHLNKVWKK